MKKNCILFASVFFTLLLAISFLSNSLVFAKDSGNVCGESVSNYVASEPDWGIPVEVGNLTELKAAISAAPVNTPTKIELTADIPFGTQTGVTIGANKYIKLTSKAGSIYKIDALQKSGVIVNTGKLYLEDIIVTGGYLPDSNTGAGIVNSGTLYMLKGTMVSENEADSGAGIVNNGIFNMYGGAITKNTSRSSGAGLYTQTPGVFTMYGGEISYNTSGYTGGGILSVGWNVSGYGTTSKVIIKGGSIYENTAATNGGGIHSRGDSGVTELTIEGGSICNNKAVSYGGGVSNVTSTKLVMSGGDIFDNTAGQGGGIYHATRSDAYNLTISGGNISNNEASNGNGGGIWTNRLLTIENGEISNNTATLNGGGIFKDGVSTLSMLNGDILKNTAVNGGGIYVNDGNMAMNSGNITGNTASNNGGGIWITNNNQNLNRLTVDAGSIFSENSAAVAYNRDAADDAIYTANIFGTNWTTPFVQGYNNYDISYQGNEQAIIYNVTFDNNDDSSPTERETRLVLAGKTLGINMPADPNHRGYIFKGWNTEKDGTGTTFKDDTMVNEDLIVYAQWFAEDSQDQSIVNDNSTNKDKTITKNKLITPTSEKSIINIPKTGSVALHSTLLIILLGVLASGGYLLIKRK